MSKSLYTVRGFKPLAENVPFNSFGVLEQFQTYEERVVSKQHEALVEMLTGPLGISTRTLSTINTLGQSLGPSNIVDDRSDKSKPVDEVSIVDLVMVCPHVEKHDLADLRPAMVEALNRWAEKSRVRGSRGWRTSAVKSPKFEKNESSSGYVLRTQILLSNAIFYDDNTVKIGVDSAVVTKDLENLKRHINKHISHVAGPVVSVLNFNHSTIGSGSI
jgi:hypothetical protein